MTLEDGVGENWFSNRVMRRIVDRRYTSFWEDMWIGEEPLNKIYPRLFSLSSQKEVKVGDVGLLLGGTINWNLTWRRQPFLWEINLINNLLAILEGVNFGNEVDKWVWLSDDGGIFTVKSSYTALEPILLSEDVSAQEEGVFSLLWRSPVPSKVVAFSWTLLLDRIRTRANLALRHILEPDSSLNCVLYGRGVETSTHLFLHCDVSSLILRGILNWLDFDFVTPRNLFFAIWFLE